MELDETDPTVWLKLEAATNDYIKNNSTAFKKVCENLLQNQNDEKLPDSLHSQFKAKRPNTGMIADLNFSYRGRCTNISKIVSSRVAWVKMVNIFVLAETG